MFVAEAFAQTTEPPAADTHAGTQVPGGEAHGEFPPFDTTHYPSQLLWLAITFGLFYLFLKRVALPRIGGILEVRRDRIAHDLDTAARMKEEADEAVAAYEQELAAPSPTPSPRRRATPPRQRPTPSAARRRTA